MIQSQKIKYTKGSNASHILQTLPNLDWRSLRGRPRRQSYVVVSKPWDRLHLLLLSETRIDPGAAPHRCKAFQNYVQKPEWLIQSVRRSFLLFCCLWESRLSLFNEWWDAEDLKKHSGSVMISRCTNQLICLSVASQHHVMEHQRRDDIFWGCIHCGPYQQSSFA